MGDIKNAIKKLQTASKNIKFDFGSNLKELTSGSPTHYLTLYHYLFLNYSPLIAAEILNKHQLELQNKSDKMFMEGVYKLLRDMFDYIPKLNQTQFFMPQYGQVKAIMACEIISLIQQKAKSLQPSSALTASASSIAKSLHSLTQPTTSSLAASVATASSASTASSGQTSSSSTGLFRSSSLRLTTFGKKNSVMKTPMAIQNHLVQSDKQDTILPQNGHEQPMNYANQSARFERLENELTSVKSRLELVESKIDILIRQNESLLKTQQTQSRLTGSTTNQNNNIAQLTNNELENLRSRLTIVETELLVQKKKTKTAQQIEDQNETTFHSFLNETSNDFNGSVIAIGSTTNGNYMRTGLYNENVLPSYRNGPIYQGEPVEFDKIDDHSINSNDSTPTLGTNLKESRFLQNSDQSINTNNSNLNKAKDAVFRASIFCNELNKINQQSKA